MNKLSRKRPASLAAQGQETLYRMRAVNASDKPGRKPSLKKLLAQGSQILDRLGAQDPHYLEEGQECWQGMEVAWNSTSRADRRTALTCLQQKLQQWTAEDANVAADSAVQKFRKTLHLALDH